MSPVYTQRTTPSVTNNQSIFLIIAECVVEALKEIGVTAYLYVSDDKFTSPFINIYRTTDLNVAIGRMFIYKNGIEINKFNQIVSDDGVQIIEYANPKLIDTILNAFRPRD